MVPSAMTSELNANRASGSSPKAVLKLSSVAGQGTQMGGQALMSALGCSEPLNTQ